MSIYDGFPPTIRISPLTIRIEIVEEVNHGRAWGECDLNKLVIRLDASPPDGAMAVDTVWHELLHVIWSYAEISNKDSEERIITTLARWKTKVLLDNPALLAWEVKTINA